MESSTVPQRSAVARPVLVPGDCVALEQQRLSDPLELGAEGIHTTGERLHVRAGGLPLHHPAKVAHAHGTEGMKRAVLAGVSSIEHGTYMSEEVMDLMIERGTVFVPTIMAGNWVAQMAKIDGFFPELVRPKAAEIGPIIKSTFAAAYKRGVPIVFGTDTGVSPHGDNAQEFALMVEGGMPPMEAIQSATSVAADFLDIGNSRGRLKTGYQADIIAVPGDPLDDITVMERVSFVMKDGTIYKQ